MEVHNFHMVVPLTAHLTPNISVSFALSHLIAMVWKSASFKVHVLDATRMYVTLEGGAL